MEKKTYIIPTTTSFSIELQQIIAYSGESTDDIQIGDNDDEQDKGDESDDDNRSRLYHPWETEL